MDKFFPAGGEERRHARTAESLIFAGVVILGHIVVPPILRHMERQRQRKRQAQARTPIIPSGYNYESFANELEAGIAALQAQAEELAEVIELPLPLQADLPSEQEA